MVAYQNVEMTGKESWRIHAVLQEKEHFGRRQPDNTMLSAAEPQSRD
jgi:hypothetical protein